MLRPTHTFVLILALLSARQVVAEPPTSKTALAATEALFDAFNRHDPAAMADLVSSDFELYYIDTNGIAGLALRGPEELAAEMTRYFASRPSVRSEITGAVDGPAFVSFRERIVGGQSSVAVYEVRDGLVRRAWYFPAEDDPTAPDPEPSGRRPPLRGKLGGR